jgi:hypothetical protein
VSGARVLIGCECSGVVREAFRALGHDAWSCDTSPSEDGSLFHICGDVRDHLSDGWDLGIFHPPCTRLCNSGVRWLAERNLWGELQEAAALFLDCLNAPIPRVAVENPVMHGHASSIIGRGPNFTIQPWQFGDNFRKRTCFWTRGLPPLWHTSSLTGDDAIAAVHNEPPSKNRARNRSVTYPGVAFAMAAQWGSVLWRDQVRKSL